MLCIVIPAYNEGKKIKGVITDIKSTLGKKVKYRLLIIDNGSKDNTSDEVRSMGIRPIVHRKNKGYGGSLITGFNAAKKLKADIVVTFDGDGQHKASDIFKVIRPIQEKNADIVIGTRDVLNNEEIPFYRKAGIEAITVITSLLIGLKISDAQSGFRAYSKKAVNTLSLKNEGMGFSIETLFDVAGKNIRLIEVPITCSYRQCPHKENPISHGMSLLKTVFQEYARRRF